MRQILIISILLSALYAESKAKLIPAKGVLEAQSCVLQIVANKMNIALKPEINPPTVRVEGETSLKYFQDSIEKFWKIRPDLFTNVFNPLTNEIFIMADRKYYDKMKRSIYDSLAHELTHYMQFHYQGVSFTEEDDSVELHAVDVQTWFRDLYQPNFVKDRFICPL